MSKLDFRFFGITPHNQELLSRIYEALSEFRSYGVLELRSASLYYESISAASKALGIPIATYRTLLAPHRLPPVKAILMTNNLRERWESIRQLNPLDGRRYLFKASISESVRNLILDGSRMMMELPDTERSRLFNKGYSASTTRERFVSIIELWKRDRSEKLQGHCIDGPVASAEPLLTAYLRMWNLRSQVRTFFQCSGVKRFLDQALNCETEIEGIADVSKICSVASDIFREYHEYHRQWLETRDHMKAERKLVNHSKRKRLLADLKARDGEHCRECGNRVSDSDSRIDHIRPVSDGGPSALENLQLLCHACNTKKGNSTTAP